MKKIFLFAAMTMAALVGCNKNPIPFPEDPTEAKPGECILTIRPDMLMTKAENSVTLQKTIWNVQVFVFRAGDAGDAGMLEIAKSAGSFSPVVPGSGDTPLSNNGAYSGITVKCSTGMREVWVVCNDATDHTAGDTAIQTKEEFLALTHNLEDSSPSKLLMIGRSNPEGSSPVINLVEGASTVSVPVHRLAASIVLETVKNDFLSPAYQKAGVFRLDAAYLLNVPGWIDFGEISSATDDPSPFNKWYAKLAAETAGTRAAILYDNLGGELCEYGATTNVNRVFYTYRNDCAPSEAGTFGPRATVLVLEASIKYKTSTGADNWVKYFYPVTIGAADDMGNVIKKIEANKQYHVSLTINRPGSTDPNKPVTFNELTPSITVTDWVDGDSYPTVI